MSNPLVSICLPCFNAERYIGAAIESVLAQTYAPIEVIVVDDGSSDGSAEVVGSYQANGVRLVSGHHMGAAAARNLALAHSSGRFVLFLDADDLIGPNHVESLAARLEETDRRLAFGRLARFSGNTAGARFSPDLHCHDLPGIEWLCRHWIGGAPVVQCGMFLIPSVLIKDHGGWDERLSLLDDFEFFSRIICKSDGLAYAPQACLYYRVGIPGSLSRQVSREAYQSACLSCLLAVEYLLAAQDSLRTRKACANMLQAFVYEFYPLFSDMRAKIGARMDELGESDIKPPGPLGFHLLRRWIVWHVAALFQKLANRDSSNLSRATGKI